VSKNEQKIVVDVGNTSIKVGCFKDNQFFEKHIFSSLSEFEQFIFKLNYTSCLYSSVRSAFEDKKILNSLKHIIFFKDCIIPIKNSYKTPKTLGSDRIANAVGVSTQSNTNKLIIDVGTCVKIDFVDAYNVFHGGSISPGIELRYRALIEFTGQLPLVDSKEKISHLGKSTNECLQSGVMNGIQGEINYFISDYLTNYPDLTIFVTGGDANYFDYSSKNDIFANPNLTLEGLFYILKENE
jgi:type III pantothenate kinase